MVSPIETSLATSSTLMGHEELFYQSAEFWVGAAFVLLIVALFSPMAKILKKMMQQRINRIKDELAEAENLKLDAQKLYADYERKFINTDNEVAQIIENQTNTINQTKEKKTAELNSLLKHKQMLAEAKVTQRYKQEQAEINKLIGQKSLVILDDFLKYKLTKNDYNQLIENSIDNVKNLKIG